MKRHVPVYCIVPPDTVADIQKYILDEHQSQPDISISPDPISQHRDTRILLKRTGAGSSQVMDIPVIDDTQRNNSRSSHQA